MKQTEFTTIILTPTKGKYLTQASQDIDIKERIIATTVAIGKNDLPDNWCEITATEKARYELLRDEADRYQNE